MNFLHATSRVASLLVGSDSFSTTSAACVSSEDVTPAAISARLRIEHGAISHPHCFERPRRYCGADISDGPRPPLSLFRLPAVTPPGAELW
jgi:hypothetical protein